MKKRALFALGGVAALSLAVSPFLLTNASAVAEPDETVAIDYVDVTNGDGFVIKDQSLSDSLMTLIEGDPHKIWCATINEDNELVETQPGEDLSPYLCFFIDPDVEGDKVIAFDDCPADELIIFENVTFDFFEIGSDQMIRYTISKLYTGMGFAFISGENQTYAKGSENGLEVHATSNVDYLVSVVVDGNELSEDEYTVENGSIILNLLSSYLDSLSIGKHTLEINFDDIDAGEGSLETTFTVEDNPNTADLPMGIFVVFGSCLVLGASGIAYMANRRSRR